MKIFHEDYKKDKRPFILGLTSNLINASVTNVKRHLIELQQSLNATIKTNYEEGFKM